MTMQFCSLASGSSGNCHLVKDGKHHILIDAGLSGKKIENKLKEIDVNPKDLSAIVVSHEHSDHICGAGILSRRYDIPIYANSGTWKGMEPRIGEIAEKNIKHFNSNENFYIGDFNIRPYDISHDAIEPVGFSILKNNNKISIATDLGCMTKHIMEELKDSNLLILESNHDEEMLKAGHYPYSLKRRILSDIGHLSNEAAGNAIVDLINKNIGTVVLAHLSNENNFPELAIITIKNILASNQIRVGEDIDLDLIYRDRISSVYEF